MSASVIRPRLADLVFHLYGRPLHPELFEVAAQRRIQRDAYELSVSLTPTGHACTWRSRQLTLTEVTASAEECFPERNRLLSHPVRGELNTRELCLLGISYQMSFQVEVLPPEIFLHVHDEIVADGGKRGLLHNFQPHNRLALSPLGFATAEANCKSLILTTFHTFPTECAVVKTQSLIEQV